MQFVALAAAVVHLSGGGLSVTLPPGWQGRISLFGEQATLRASTSEVSLRLDEVGNRPGTDGFLPMRRIVLRPRDFRTPRLAIRRVAVHGRSFVAAATVTAPESLGAVNDVLARVRISPPVGLSRAERRRLERPLRLPRLRRGSRCPTSRLSRAAPSAGATLGPGPAYSVISGARAGEEKTLWAVSPRYRGPLLIRGRRLDGPGVLRFNLGRRPRMWWQGLWPDLRRRWRYGPSTTFIPAPGCYAFQVDGSSFSERIVFVAG